MSIRDVLDRLEAKYGQDPRLQDKSLGEQVMGIPWDVLSSAGELLGIQKSPDQLIRERKYPVTTFAAGLVGFGVPYLGSLKALSKVDKINDAVNRLQWMGKAAESPIKTRMLQETARVGILETGRVAAGMAIPGGDSLEEMLGDSALNLALGAGLVGAGSLIAQGGRRNAPLQEIFKDIDLNAPQQVQLRQLSKALREGTIDPKHTLEAQNRLAKLSDNIRMQLAPQGQPYVQETLKGGGKRINRLFNTKGGKSPKTMGLVRRRLGRTSDEGFANDAAWQGIVAASGLPAEWTHFIQYPRHLSFRLDSAAKQIQNTIYQTMESVGDGWHMTREVNDGLFVMARKIKGTAGKPSTTDEWTIFKTDQPEVFRPLHGKWSGAVADHMHYLAKDTRPKGPVTDIYDSARKMSDTLPLRRYVDSKAAAGTAGEFAEKMTKTFGLDGAMKNTGEVTKRVKDFFVEHLAPTVQQFGRSPRAGRAMAIAQATYDAAESVMRKMVYGERGLDPKKTPFSHIMGKPVDPQGPSIKGILDPLSEDEIKQLWNVWRSQAGTKVVDDLYAAGKITDKVRDAVAALQKVDDEITTQIMKVESVTGGGNFKPREGHYGLSRRWEGDNRVAIRDAEDKVIGVASGQSRVGAQRAADKLLKQLEGEGIPGLRLAEEFDITQVTKLPRDLQLHVSNPAWVLERQNVRGFKFDDRPFTKEELLEAYGNSIQSRTKYMANRTVADLLSDDIAKVAVEDPTMHRILVGRLNDLAGQRTPLAKVMDQAVDSVLGPVLGKNTATQIVAATNKAMWHLELGALRLAYPAMNMLTFLQTTVPEVAFVTTASPDILGKYYNVFTMQGAKTIRPAGILDPLKLWVQGTKQMHSKNPGFLKAVERGLNDGVIDPRFIEEHTGSIGERLKWNTAIKEGGFVKWLEAVSEFLPAQSEKWSRLNAFSTGHVVGKELLKITDEDLLYKFAKDFTDRTMFRYGMDARPRVFTTPAGSLLGLFKNWMMHYVGMMLDYTGEGVKRNNWAPLLWQTAGTAAVGGASAMPLWAAANGLSNAMTGKSALVNGYEAMEPLGDGVSDAVFFGLPAFLGVSLSSNATAPFSNPMRDVTQLASLVHYDRVKAAGKFFGNAMDHWEATGEGPMSDPNTRDQFLRAFAPKTAYRLAATLEDGVINSLSTSTPVMKNVGPMEKIWFSLGFNPTQIEKAYAISDELWQDQAKHRDAVQKYGEAMYGAYQRNDQREMEVIVARALVEGIDVSSIERSAMARLSKDETDMLNRQFKPEDIEERLVVMGDQYKAPEKGKP